MTTPDYPSPGDAVQGLCAEHGMSLTDLAKTVGWPRTYASRIVHGKVRVTALTAMKLAQVFPEHGVWFWLNLQARADLRKLSVHKEKKA